MPKAKKNSVVKSAIYFASGTLVSRVLGLLRDALLVAIFDKTTLDAWYAAFRLPNIFRRLFGEGAFSACFIPSYVDYKESGDEAARAQLTSGVLGLLALVLFPLTIFMTLSMDWIIPMWLGGKGFSDIPGKMELTIFMAKVMFPFLMLMSIFAFMMAILNAHKKFLMTSLAPAFLNISIILACIYCYQKQDLSGVVLALSVLIGGLFQFLVLLPTFKNLSVLFSWAWKSIYSQPVQHVLKVFVPTVFGIGIIQLMSLVNTALATYLEEGAVTHIYLADRLLELPLSLISVSLGAALLPILSEKLSQGSPLEYKSELFKNLRVLLFLCIPSAVGLWMIAEPLTRLLFERGAFSSEESTVVALVAQVYAFTLIGASVARLMSQAFYADKDTKTPAWGSFIALSIHILLAPFLMKLYGIIGLVVSTSLVTFANAFFLFFRFHKKFGSLEYKKLGVFIFKCCLSCSSIVVVAIVVSSLFEDMAVVKIFQINIIILFQVLVTVLLSSGSYFAFCRFFKLEEAQIIFSKFMRRRS